MNKGEYARPCPKFGIIEQQMEPVLSHRRDEGLDSLRFNGRGDVDIAAEAGTSPNNRSLGTKDVPGEILFGHHGGERLKKLSDRAAA